jgi:hypothetical protein
MRWNQTQQLSRVPWLRPWRSISFAQNWSKLSGHNPACLYCASAFECAIAPRLVFDRIQVMLQREHFMPQQITTLVVRHLPAFRMHRDM